MFNLLALVSNLYSRSIWCILFHIFLSFWFWFCKRYSLTNSFIQLFLV